MRRRRATIVAALLAIVGLLVWARDEPVRAGGSDDAVTLHIGNDGAEVLRCVVLFGHWVSLDLGVVGAGASHALAMMRDSSDGSLYVARDDGRAMMIENVVCGADGAWAETLGQVPLLPVRSSGEQELRTSCRIDDRVTCTPPSGT